MKLAGILLALLAASACATVDDVGVPLGSRENSVKSDMPAGERAYLNRLRCEDAAPPKYNRVGSFGAGPDGHIIDGYQVTCPGSAPAEALIFMDMYHGGHVETRAVPGFIIVAP